MNFNKKLVMLRKELDLTQEEFAKKIGFSRTAISAWEIGRNEPSYDQILKLADFFNVSIDFLLGKTDSRTSINKNDIFMAAYDSDELEESDKKLLLDLYYNMIKNKKKEQ